MEERPRDFTAPLIAASLPRDARQNTTMGLSIETRFVRGRWHATGYEVAEFSNGRTNNSGWGLLALCTVTALVLIVAAVATLASAG
jgi:hypothetical protein